MIPIEVVSRVGPFSFSPTPTHTLIENEVIPGISSPGPLLPPSKTTTHIIIFIVRKSGIKCSYKLTAVTKSGRERGSSSSMMRETVNV